MDIQNKMKHLNILKNENEEEGRYFTYGDKTAVRLCYRPHHRGKSNLVAFEHEKEGENNPRFHAIIDEIVKQYEHPTEGKI